MKMMKMMLQVRVPQDQLFRILVQLEGLHEVVGTRTGTACDAWGGGFSMRRLRRGEVGGAGGGASFLSSDGLRYGARWDHVQQVLSLPVR